MSPCIKAYSKAAGRQGPTRAVKPTLTTGPQKLPEPAMESHFAYGARAGYWRILRVLDQYQVTCTLNICAQALEKTPWIAEDGLKRGYELACHGYRWETPAGKNENW